MIPNPYSEDRKPSPGEKEVEKGNYLLMAFRWLGVPLPRDTDPAAVERVGVLLARWWRRKEKEDLKI